MPEPLLKPANFDPIARPYRWLEYLTLGSLLQRARTHFLPRLLDRRRALVFGDGDGRFLAQLLRQNPTLQADAVDISAAMLNLLAKRAAAPNRLRLHHQDALTFTPATPPDLIVTHFFLDCLTQPEVDQLAASLVPILPQDSLWLVSDFRIPPGVMRIPASLYVAFLYRAFRLITGLRTTRLPDHAAAFTRAGLTRIARNHTLFGLLTAELWQKSL